MSTVQIVVAVLGAVVTAVGSVLTVLAFMRGMLRQMRDDIVLQVDAKIDHQIALVRSDLNAYAAVTNQRLDAIERTLQPISDALVGKALAGLPDAAAS